MPGSLKDERIQFIVNPRANCGRSGRVWTVLVSEISKLDDIHFIWDICRKAKDARTVVKRGIKKGCTTIIVVGGDGTFFNILNAVIEEDAMRYPDLKMGFWPTGTGTDLARSMAYGDNYKVQTYLAEAVCQKIDIGRAEMLELGKNKDEVMTKEFGEEEDEDDDDGKEERKIVRYYANSASVGFTAEVANKVNKTPKVVSAKALFTLGTHLVGKNYQARDMEITADEKQIANGKTLLVTADNGSRRNGGLLFAPDAALNDGLLDIVTVKEPNAQKIKQTMRMAYKGEHVKGDTVSYCQAKKVMVDSASSCFVELDGEIPGKTPVAFQILPQFLPFWLPPAYNQK